MLGWLYNVLLNEVVFVEFPLFSVNFFQIPVMHLVIVLDLQFLAVGPLFGFSFLQEPWFKGRLGVDDAFGVQKLKRVLIVGLILKERNE